MSERVGRTCETHNEWCHDGVCPWCPPWSDPVHVHIETIDAAAVIRMLDSPEFRKAMQEAMRRP